MMLTITRDSLSSATLEELGELSGWLNEEIESRKPRETEVKDRLAKANKRDPRCPECKAVLWKDGKREDGSQRYRCPKCGARSCDTSWTSLHSSKISSEKIMQIITLAMFDLPIWVISRIAGVSDKTALYWRDRCLDAAQSWSRESALSGHVWIDEMRFAPMRAEEDMPTYVTYAGKIARDAYLEVAFDSNGNGFCKAYEKLGMPTRDMVVDALGDRIKPGSKLTHDGALCHNLLVKNLNLVDDWHKFVKGEKEYERSMKLMSNCCSFLRHCFEGHPGIKFAKLEAYANLFLYRWCHVRKGGLDAAIEYMFRRVCGTPKSHKSADMFGKNEDW